MSEDPVVGELWECRKTHRAVVVEDVAGGWVHVQPVGLGARFSMFPAAFLRDWKRADDRYQPSGEDSRACAACGRTVPEGEGVLRVVNGDGHGHNPWRLFHRTCHW